MKAAFNSFVKLLTAELGNEDLEEKKRYTVRGNLDDLFSRGEGQVIVFPVKMQPTENRRALRVMVVATQAGDTLAMIGEADRLYKAIRHSKSPPLYSLSVDSVEMYYGTGEAGNFNTIEIELELIYTECDNG